MSETQPRTIDQLAQTLSEVGGPTGSDTRPSDGAVLRFALITAVGSGGNLGKAQTDATGAAWVPCDASYSPVVADKVYLLSQGPTVVIINALRKSTTPGTYSAADAAAAAAQGKPHASRFLQSATVTVPDSTWTDIPFDTNLNEIGGLTWNATSNQFEIPYGGHYLVEAAARWNVNTMIRQLRIMFNGTVRAYDTMPASMTGPNRVARVHRLTTAGQAIKVQAFQDSGSSQTLFQSGNPWCYVDVTWLGATT